MPARKWFGLACLLLGFQTSTTVAQVSSEHVHDLSLEVARDLPCVWPLGMTPLGVVATHTIGSSNYHRDLLIIDEHTGTQWDAPAHFVPPPDSGLPGAGPNGSITGEKVPAWQFCGEACVIDISQFCDRAGDGDSFLIPPEIVIAWEKENRPLKFGDVVLFRSGYTDKYYKPFPEGDRFVASALRKDTPGWPAPTPETMKYLGEKGVMTLGLDSASMGPLPNMAVATHQAGGQLGMIWTECATGLSPLPTTGSFYAILAAKHAGGSGGECRSIGISEPKLAARLNEDARNKRVVDLSVTLDEDYPVVWTGYGPGEEGGRYVGKVLNKFSAARGPYFAMTHMFDSQVGTHLTLPSYSLPSEKGEFEFNSPETKKLADEFEKKFGPRPVTKLTIEDAPLNELMGDAYLLDVRSLKGTTSQDSWPNSPTVTADFIKKYEKEHGEIKQGMVVLLYSGYSDEHFKPLPASPELDGMFAAPLGGKAEGWVSYSPEAVIYLAEKGIRCIGTDGPTIGGANRNHALQVYWAAGARNMLAVEYLTNLSSLEDKDAFFLFAPIKIRGTKGGYGRALALWRDKK